LASVDFIAKVCMLCISSSFHRKQCPTFISCLIILSLVCVMHH
jgi:hypothetical protein